jgi:hypothetical protein
VSYRDLQDRLHQAIIDERAADSMADRDVIECPECGGTGLSDVDGPPCIYCSGSGYWLGSF